MKDENRELLIEIKGKLGGVACCIAGGAKEALWDVVELLDVMIEDEKKRGEIVLNEADFNTIHSCA